MNLISCHRQSTQRRRQWAIALSSMLLAFVAVSHSATAGTLESIYSRKQVVCGVDENNPGFSISSSKGWSGLGVDFCEALAAAVLGDAKAVKFIALATNERFSALKAGTVDVLPASAEWTLNHEAEFGMRFAGIIFFDGQGFMIRRGDAVASILEMSGSTICVMAGTRGETAVSDYFTTRKMKYQLVVGTSHQEIVKAYANGGCTVITGDISQLAIDRGKMQKPNDHFIVPELAAKQPVGPVVRQGDEAWFSVVRWVLMALIAAEEQGVTRENIDEMKKSTSHDIQRLLGMSGGLGQTLGLENSWAVEAIRNKGNYGELFERNLGAASGLKLERGLNNNWTKGGLMYSAPLR